MYALPGLSLITCLHHAPLVFVVAHVDQSFGLCVMFLPLSDFFLSFPLSFPLSFFLSSLSLSFPSLRLLSVTCCVTLSLTRYALLLFSLSRLVFILVLLKIT